MESAVPQYPWTQINIIEDNEIDTERIKSNLSAIG